jgi:predicted nucleic acid-binding protein
MKEEKNNKKTYLDTFVFMDILSGDAALSQKALQYVKEAEKEGAVVSTIIFSELAYHIRRHRGKEKTEEILFYVRSLPNLNIIPVTEEIAKTAGMMRAKYRKMKLPKKFTYFDCIHLATALSEGCKRFVTGDKGFKDVKEIHIEVY